MELSELFLILFISYGNQFGMQQGKSVDVFLDVYTHWTFFLGKTDAAEQNVK